LSPTRTITVAGTAGKSFLKENFPSSQVVNKPLSGLSASAEVNLQFARSWSASGEFRRSVDLLQGLERSYYGNSFGFNVRGEPTKRIDVNAGAHLLRSNPTSDVVTGKYDTVTASAQMRYALTRSLAVVTEYLHTKYDFGAGAQLPSGVLRTFGREVLRVGLTFGAPVIGRRVAP
jgi:hypothetical protein